MRAPALDAPRTTHPVTSMNAQAAPTLPAVPAGTNDIRGVKPPVEIPSEWAWVWWTLAALVVAVLAFMAWRWWRKKRATVPPAVVIPPHVRAKQRLAEALFFIADPNRFCTEVSNAVRFYLEERFTLRAPERTTEEFLTELQKSRHLTRDQKESLGAFLESCDLVKFARFEPTETALRQLHDSALRLVDETQFDPIDSSGPATPPMPPLPPMAPASPAAPPELAQPKS